MHLIFSYSKWLKIWIKCTKLNDKSFQVDIKYWITRSNVYERNVEGGIGNFKNVVQNLYIVGRIYLKILAKYISMPQKLEMTIV